MAFEVLKEFLSLMTIVVIVVFYVGLLGYVACRLSDTFKITLSPNWALFVFTSTLVIGVAIPLVILFSIQKVIKEKENDYIIEQSINNR